MVRLEDRGVQRSGPRAAKAEVGHDEEGHELAAPDPGDRGRHPDGHGDTGPPQERPRKRDARIGQRLCGLPLLRGVQGDRAEGQVRHRHLLQPGGRGHQGRRDRGGTHREAPQVRCLPEDARRPLRRDRGQGHAQSRPVRAGGQAAVRERARADEAPDRGGQAAHRLRRPAGHVPVHRQEDAGPRSLPGDLPGQPAGRGGQGVRLHHRLQRPLPLAGGRDPGIHGRSVRGLRPRRRGRPVAGPPRAGSGTAGGDPRGGQGAVRTRRAASRYGSVPALFLPRRKGSCRPTNGSA